MESYDKPNCVGCHAKAVVTNNDSNPINTDFMYWLALEVAALENNSLSYALDYQGQQCQPGAGVLETEFLLEGAVLNATVIAQAFDLVVGIQLPTSVPAPGLQAFDPSDGTSPWILDGMEVTFEVDSTCESRQCEVDLNYATPSSHRWVQYRTTEPVSLTQADRQFAGLLRYRFATNDCTLLDQQSFRAWASDSSSSEHANFVDAAVVSGTHNDGPADGPTHQVHALGLWGLFTLIGLLLMMGWQTSQRSRNH
jgi:hypothetical protein